MKVPIQIVFRNMERIEKVEELINERASKLDKVFDRIVSTRFVVEVPHKSHKQGNDVEVTIDISVPGKNIVVSRTAKGNNGKAGDVHAAFKEAFETAKRQLEDYASKRRGEQKVHEVVTPPARISQLFADDGYGFLETPDGREIYFHSNSVVNDKFEKLAVGTEVTFVEREGEDGPQASTVKVKSAAVKAT